MGNYPMIILKSDKKIVSFKKSMLPMKRLYYLRKNVSESYLKNSTR